MEKSFVIDGNNFSDYEGFCDEFSRVILTNKYHWTGNLNAFNDILFGGFGDIQPGECYTIVWKNVKKSKVDLGYPETVCQLKITLKNCQPSNKDFIQEELKNAEHNIGPTIFDWLIEIIYDNNNVKLIIEE